MEEIILKTVRKVKDELVAHDLAMTERVEMTKQHIKEVVRAEFDELREYMDKKQDESQKHDDKKFAAVHRNIRSGDTVAKMLVKVVEVVNGMTQDSDWVCDECGATASSNTRQMVEIGTPMCSECDREMRLERAPEDVIDHPDFLDGNAMVLRIYEIKAAKEADKKNKLKFKKVEASEGRGIASTSVHMNNELLGVYWDKGSPAEDRWVFVGHTNKIETFRVRTKKELVDKLKEMVKNETDSPEARE